MNEYEILLDEAMDANIHVVEDYNMCGYRLKGLYCDGVIALNGKIESQKERRCVLAEEMGHHYTSVGDITDMSIANCRRQEHRARLWGYNKIVGLSGIVDAFKARCENDYEAAEYLGVSEWYLKESLRCYRSKYGTRAVPVDTYYVIFVPHLAIINQQDYA